MEEVKDKRSNRSFTLPECYEENDDRFPLCVGNSIECINCPLYERYGIRGEGIWDTSN